jgi:hypothetical protein
MSRSPEKTYESRVETLKRRRDFLDKRIADYHGKDMNRDKAEASAIHWALGVIELHYQDAVELIRESQKDRTHE